MPISTIHSNDADLYIETSGHGPAILLIHAGVTDSRMWDDVWEHLAEHHSVIRYDLRGHGRSTIPPIPYAHHEDSLAVLDACEVDRAIVIGASMGGGIALDLALTHPERVAGLVLINTLAGMDTPSPELRSGWDSVDVAFDADDLDAATEIEMRMWVDGPHRQPHEVDPDLRERVRQMDRELLGRAHEGEFAEEIEPNVPAKERLGEITAPVLLVVGSLDFADVQLSAATLELGLSDVQRVNIPDAAHLPSMERPRSVLSAVEPFLAIQDRRSTMRDFRHA